MPNSARTRRVTAAQVRAYTGKAQSTSTRLSNEIDAERYIAATSLAIHAAINAADAVCGVHVGERAAGEAHDQVLALLRSAGGDGLAVEKELRRLLPLKTKAEYVPDDVSAGVASKAVDRAERCVAIARKAAAAG